MTGKEQRVQYHECNVARAEVKLRETKNDLARGYEKGTADLAKAKAEFEKEYARLKFEVERAEIELRSEKSWLEFSKAELERGYDTET